jgi:molybdopterin molybdotransferase
VTRAPSAAPAAPAPDDVRLRGFADLATLARAQEWVDRQARPLAVEEVALDGCPGRVLAAPLAAPADHPPAARAGLDGHAVRSTDVDGASAYDPVALRLQDPTQPLGAAAAALVPAGATLPPGADAVLGFDVAQPTGGTVDVIAAVAPGAGVDRAGQQLRAGAPIAAAGRVLSPRDAALLATLGLARVGVVARPRVHVLVAGPKEAGAADAHGPMLRALVARDGGDLDRLSLGDVTGAALALVARAPAPDLVLVTGRTGTGPDDVAAPALAEVGELALHGLALRPGGSAALGRAGTVPVVLLPGDPLACLVAYELLAGRLVRRLAGRGEGLPHPTRELEVRRKIVSAVGYVEVCQVRLVDGQVEPLGVADFGGLAAAAKADGFVIVPAPLEGYAPGTRVTVHLY